MKRHNTLKTKDLPLVSIVIATYNSSRVLDNLFRSIKKQKYPKSKLELLVIDGGSSDSTLAIARKYGAKIVFNPKVDQVYAKHKGYVRARGKYILFMDSDEILVSARSIRKKTEIMEFDTRIKAVTSTGLVKPARSPEINNYINEFGDPFSYFMYRSSKDPKFFAKELVDKNKLVYSDNDKMIFDFSKEKDPPFIELTSMACMLNRNYIKRQFPIVFKKASEHTHLFYLLNRKGNLFAVTKHDSVLHNSVSSLAGYMRKIRSRVKSNIFSTSMGMAGFAGRERFHSSWYRFKKYLFVCYCLSFVLPLVDSLVLTLTRGRLVYLVHFVLCYYTLALMLYYYVVRYLNLRVRLQGYGI